MNPAPFYAGALFLFGIVTGLHYFYLQTPMGPGFLAGALLFLIVLLCTGTGRITLRLFGTYELSQSEKTLIGCTLGLGILTQALFLLGMFGILKLWAVLALL